MAVNGPFRRSYQLSGLICQHCVREYTSRSCLRSSASSDLDVDALLAKPAWSAASLLSGSASGPQVPAVTPGELRHLLRLSAMLPPKNLDEENEMLATLSSQLHFVKEIQKADTTGVKPLRSLRDETVDGETDAELGLEDLKEAFAHEEVRGKHHKRIRRRHVGDQSSQCQQWNVLGTAERSVGRYFIVEGGTEK